MVHVVKNGYVHVHVRSTRYDRAQPIPGHRALANQDDESDGAVAIMAACGAMHHRHFDTNSANGTIYVHKTLVKEFGI